MIYSTCAYRVALSILPAISDLIGQHWQSHMPGRVTTVLGHKYQTTTLPFPILALPSHASHAGTFGSQHQTRWTASLKNASVLVLAGNLHISVLLTLISTTHHGEPGAASPCERSACLRKFAGAYCAYSSRARYAWLECESFELGEVEALGGLAALVCDCFPLDCLQLPG
jgi:hypothetical protein